MISLNELFMLHQITLLLNNFSIEFMRVSYFYLDYFKTWCTLQVSPSFQGIPIGTLCFKTKFFIFKEFMVFSLQ